MTTDFRALCAELLQPLAEYDGANPYHEHRALITRARAALAQPEGEGVTDEELRHVLLDCGYHPANRHLIALARAVLARWGHPTPPAPKPVGANG